MLPHVLRYTGQLPAAAALYTQLCRIIFPHTEPGPASLAAGFAGLAARMELPTGLTGVRTLYFVGANNF